MVVALSRSSTGAPGVNMAPEAVPSPAGQRRRGPCSSPGDAGGPRAYILLGYIPTKTFVFVGYNPINVAAGLTREEFMTKLLKYR